MKSIVMRIAMAAAVIAATIIPAAPAWANFTSSNCDDWDDFVVCIVLEFGTDAKTVRAFGSLDDNTTGTDVVAVVVHLWHYPDVRLVSTSPATLANDYALTATPWFKTACGSYEAEAEWTWGGGFIGHTYTDLIHSRC